MNLLNPPASLLVKLGSLLVHYQELHSSKGHEFDKAAIQTLESDYELILWMDAMTKAGFLPVKR